jgi:hypothetical protein
MGATCVYAVEPYAKTAQFCTCAVEVRPKGTRHKRDPRERRSMKGKLIVILREINIQHVHSIK